MGTLTRSHENNQNNIWREDAHRFYHHGRADAIFSDHGSIPMPKYKCKSDDHFPLKINSSDHRKRFPSERTNKCGQYANYPRRYGSCDIRQKILRDPKYQKFSRRYSSTEDIDFSRGNDYSSENSRRPVSKSPNSNSFRVNPRLCEKYSSKKSTDSHYYDDRRNYPGSTRKSCGGEKPQRPNKPSSLGNYNNVVNNNRCDTLPYNSCYSRLQSDINSHSRCLEESDDSLSRQGGIYNPLTLKSTYRKYENIPHSGTRLEHHRNNFDKYCDGNYKESQNIGRYNESSNRDRGDLGLVKPVNKSKKIIKCILPPSPKSNKNGKTCLTDLKVKNKMKNENVANRQKSLLSRNVPSDNKSGFFDSCRNFNNENDSENQCDHSFECKGNYDSNSDQESSEYSTESNSRAKYVRQLYSSLQIKKNLKKATPTEVKSKSEMQTDPRPFHRSTSRSDRNRRNHKH